MGACLSCLGFAREEKSDTENPETSRLLFDDPYRSQYGTSSQNTQRQSHQPDPESVRRENEALRRICHAMSDHVVDIITAVPSAPPSGQHHKPADSDTMEEEIGEYRMPSESMGFMTVQNAQKYHLSSHLGKEESEAAKAVMG